MSIASQISRIKQCVTDIWSVLHSYGVAGADESFETLSNVPNSIQGACMNAVYRMYPVGSLYASTDPDADPGVIIGMPSADWIQVAPSNVTWGNLYNATWDITDGSTDGIYVFERLS